MTTVRRVEKNRPKKLKGKTSSSAAWIKRRLDDPYVKLAQENGFRSRAAFKLMQIDDKFNIFHGVSNVLDLGSAPGSWLQVATQKKKKDGNIIGVDLKEVEPIEGVHIIHGDFYDEHTLKDILEIAPNKFCLIMSDMAANACGNKQADHLKIIDLVEMAFDFCKSHLRHGGVFISKILRGGYEAELIVELRKSFSKVKTFKPDSSHSDSSEIFLICQHFKVD